MDKLAPIRVFFDKFITNCKSNFVPGECVTIDESMFAFRGKCAFRMYMPAKPTRYGLKLYSMVDSQTFYFVNGEMYLGRQNGMNPIENTPSAVVQRLIQPISGSGRNVTTDNWYTSIPLAQTLLKDHRLTTVGTMRKNRKQLPPEFTTSRGRAENTSLFGFTNDMCLVSYVPKKGKIVNVLSTMHNDNEIDDSTGDKRKPAMITYYNGTKGGVDTNDELCGTYSVARRTRRWPQVVFQSIINLAGVNALIIFKHNHDDYNEPRRKFLKKLGQSMCIDQLRLRSSSKYIPRSLRESANRYCGLEEVPVVELNTSTSRRRCADCPRGMDRKTLLVCSKCNKPVCTTHQITTCKACYAE